jgi:hypothetical protein
LVLVLVICCSFAGSEWITIEKKNIGFKISFPRMPEETTKDVDTEIGKLKMHILLCDQSKRNDDNQLYGLIYSDYPDNVISSNSWESMIDTFFNNAIRGAAANMNGEVLNVVKATYKTYPGRQIKISFAGGQGIMHMKMFLVKSRMYIMEAGCEKSKDNNPAIEEFFKSFELFNDIK